jgi:hypothetical protein
LALSGHGNGLGECPLSEAKRTSLIRSLMSANDPKRTLFLRGHKVKVGGHLTAHSSANSIQLCAGSNAGVITRDHAIKYDYFETPTNRAPVTLPSAPMSGA